MNDDLISLARAYLLPRRSINFGFWVTCHWILDDGVATMSGCSVDRPISWIFPTHPTMANKKSSSSAVAAAKAKTVDKIEPVAFPDSFKVDQARKAVNALLAHHAKEKERISETQLMAKDEHVWLIVNTKQMPTKKSLKPIRV